MRKIWWVLLVVVVGMVVVKKTNVASYVSTAWHKVKERTKKQVPLEFEIERVRDQISQLDDDFRKCLSPIAEDMATLKGLKKKKVILKAELDEKKENVLAMTRDLEGGATSFVYGGEEFTAAEIRTKLEGDFNSFRTCEAEYKSLEKLIEAKEKSLRANREKLSSIKTLKRDLAVQLEQLEAELKTVRLAQTKDKFQVDDSRLSDIKSSLAEIEHRLEVEKNMTTLNGQFPSDPIPVQKKAKPTSELTKEVKAYFGEKTEQVGQK
jgi:chromosome segregation ATPase